MKKVILSKFAYDPYHKASVKMGLKEIRKDFGEDMTIKGGRDTLTLYPKNERDYRYLMLVANNYAIKIVER